ncbi:MAG: hypothetical protein HQL57_04520 [Magnetococcales bacterium]|nr:hypothetical protein [Magnetococcales bacterium]MBF0156427.1 hypothetical protein [Magnetococcales bacterium]
MLEMISLRKFLGNRRSGADRRGEGNSREFSRQGNGGSISAPAFERRFLDRRGRLWRRKLNLGLFSSGLFGSVGWVIYSMMAWSGMLDYI